VDQPTGGEIGLSPRLANHILGQSFPRSALGYGIDIFLVTSAAMFTGRMAVVNLGRKVHRRRKWSTIAPIAQQVLETILSQAAEHKEILRQYTEITTPIRHGMSMADDEIRPAPGAIDESLNSQLTASYASGMRQWRDIYETVFPRRLTDELHDRASVGAGIPAHTWRQALLALAAKSISGTLEHATAAAAAMPLFNARMVTYAEEIATLSPQRLEQLLASERSAIFDSRTQVLRAP
jgi:hypothetical protein